MRTYLTLWFNSDGVSPTEAVRKLSKIGFKPQQGAEDCVYIWDKKPQVEEVLSLGNLVRKVLSGGKVLFTLETL